MSLETLSDVIGWLYFFAWSISFYPQFILNWRRKSVNGLSLEFQMYNITGFTFYTIYTVTNYKVQHDLGLSLSVTPPDVAFAVHAALITYLTVIQCFIWKREDDTVNKWHLYICSVFWILSLYNVALSLGGVLPWYTADKAEYNYNTVEFLGYIKACISLIKYTPQAYMNWVRKSTVGWSIGNVLLDFTGGSLSFLQQVVDAERKNDYSIITKNIPKFLLSLESVGFDILFIVQHYVLYRGAKDPVALAAVTSDDASAALITHDSTDEHHRREAALAAGLRHLEDGAGAGGASGTGSVQGSSSAGAVRGGSDYQSTASSTH